MGSTLLAVLSATALLTNCADVATAIYEERTGIPFEITGFVVRDENDGPPFLNIADETGGTIVVNISKVLRRQDVRDGDIFRIRGIVRRSSVSGQVGAHYQEMDFLRHENLPEPIDTTIDALETGRFDCRQVRIRGQIMEVFRDEIDPRYVYASLISANKTICLTFKGNDTLLNSLLALRGATVAATGWVSGSASTARRSLGRTFSCRGLTDLTVLVPPPKDPFDVPLADAENQHALSELPSMGRRRAVGTVTAVQSNRRIHLRDDSGKTRQVKLSTDRLPRCGDRIEAAGLPETDFYRINLTDADWRLLSTGTVTDEVPARISVANLLTDAQGRPRITSSHHGRLVRLEGLVVDQPSADGFQNTLMLKDGGLVIPVDLTSAKDVLSETSVGCQIAVTGICIVETETWRPTAGFPHATGVVIIPRSADDIDVLSRPSWWTPRRFMILVAVLLALLVVILVWNRVLQSVIRRKSHQLMREQLAKVRSELRVSERTNLAVELHDALSQNLTGLAFQLATAKSALTADPAALPRHLDTAERMLVSSRTELKRCLSDLRENMLDEKDFTAAIRRILIPVAGNAAVDVDFPVSRQKLDDTTAHSILCIIRELAANAVLHGHATRLDVRGEVRKDQLSFSVTDNGSGFDPATRPGIAEGHFGLDGIAERVEQLNGTLSVDSAPGRGTRVTVSEIAP